MMLIAEHFILIAIDPATGIPVWPRWAPSGRFAAAALLLELAILHRLELRDGLLHADAASPLSHALPKEALHELAGRPQSIPDAIDLLERRLYPLEPKILEGLYYRDILHRVENRTWLLQRRVRYPLRSVQARNEALQHLRHTLHDTDDLHGFALLLLVETSGVLTRHLDAHEYAMATQHLLALNEAPDSTRQIFAAVRAALLD